jgi:uncharacterized protein (DUF927 family)
MADGSIKSIIPDFTREDYLQSTKPFDWLYERKGEKFILKQYVEQMQLKAQAVGVRTFKALWKDYQEMMAAKGGVVLERVTEFDGQDKERLCGSYICDDMGITIQDKYGAEVLVCDHPIMPVQRLVNVDSGEVKIELAYKRRGIWTKKIFDKSTLSSSQKIVELSKYGIAVDSENARDMVRYLSALENMNYNELPETKSVGRLGWIPQQGFSPYVEHLVFDGDLSFKSAFEAVQEHGSFEKWMDCALSARQNGAIGRIMLASSFASALVDVCNALPFFVHLWGGTGSGKTVAMMLAASVWANPSMGQYIHTFNSTPVAQELMAGFCNSLPLCVDELQITGQRDFDSMIYMLTEGVGRGRGAKSGGLQRVQTWKNSILTTGEMPINKPNSGGGAVNRVIDIDCADTKIFQDAHEVVEIITQNYGFAGRLFVEALKDDDFKSMVIQCQQDCFAKLIESDTTEKQAQAASIILTADAIAEKVIFHDGVRLTMSDIKPFLATKAETSANSRAYEWLLDWVASNAVRFGNKDSMECYGCIDGQFAYIIKSVFDRVMSDEGFNSQAFLSWAGRNNVIERGDKNTKKKRISGFENPVRCVWLRLQNDFEDLPDNTKTPF